MLATLDDHGRRDRVCRRKMAIVRAPKAQRRHGDARVLVLKFGKRALVTGAHADDELAHIAPSKTSPEIFTDVIGNLPHGAPKNYTRQMAKRELIEPVTAEQRDLPRGPDIPLQQRSGDDAMRNAIGISRGGDGRRL